MIDDSPRSLREDEKLWLMRLLTAEFPGVSELRDQAAVARAIPTDEVGTILFDLPVTVVPSNVRSQHPVLGAVISDDKYIELELFVVEGRLKLMGFVMITPPLEPDVRVLPKPESISVYVAEGPRGPYRLSVQGDLPTFIPRSQPVT